VYLTEDTCGLTDNVRNICVLGTRAYVIWKQCSLHCFALLQLLASRAPAPHLFDLLLLQCWHVKVDVEGLRQVHGLEHLAPAGGSDDEQLPALHVPERSDP
jgi:hypothetical protein